MSYTLQTQGADRLASLLGAFDKETERAQKNALNAAASEFKRGFVNDISAGTGLKKKLVRGRIRVSRAKGAAGEARIIPDSQGLPITEYTWRPEPAGHPTRARILIRWFGGWKVAAGFINPESERPLPLKTITSKGRRRRPVLAHGVSVAAAFKHVRDDGRLDRYSARLAEIFEEKLEEQINRRA
ncbi:phage tail protein [Marinobacter subterrani]|uniref:Prophage minor tail protein Z (GPZ) n=1 Tax=Marinobacter subterrani TaxID=1658765 RepID=A0A0J7M2R1_9GAMM|nr:phage tail protein [Marinobacter subterrani]KMQ75300.1 Prophage minor tail protein Z (GPZ) [Marinobacter subterrani]